MTWCLFSARSGGRWILKIVKMWRNSWFLFSYHLSSCICCCCVFFGEETLTSDFLVQSCKLYMSSDEKEVIYKSLGLESKLNDEDLLDFLTSCKCYKNSRNENIKTIIQELAPQEIVQKQRYIVEYLAPMLNVLRAYPYFQTLEAPQNVYSANKPSSKKVIKLFSAKPKSAAKRDSFDHRQSDESYSNPSSSRRNVIQGVITYELGAYQNPMTRTVCPMCLTLWAN